MDVKYILMRSWFSPWSYNVIPAIKVLLLQITLHEKAYCDDVAEKAHWSVSQIQIGKGCVAKQRRFTSRVID